MVEPARSARPSRASASSRPAHYLRVGPEGIREERRWWDIDFTPRDGAPGDEQLIEELRELLSDSTRIRLRADVPVAAYLSGGLDSSATATLARQHMTNTLYSFGLGFADERFDESAFQDRIVEELGTDLTRVVIESPRHRRAAAARGRAVREADAADRARAAAAALEGGPGRGPQGRAHGRGRRRALRRLRRVPRERRAPLLGPRARVEAAPAALRAAERVHRGRPQALGRLRLELLRARARPTRTTRSTATASASRTPRARSACSTPGVVERARAADDPAARLIAAAARAVRALQPARQGAVRRDPDLPRGLPAALAGRPDADGPLDRGPLPVPRLPRRGVRRRAARPAAAARARGEVRAAPRRQHVPAGGGLRAPQASVPGADRPRLRRRGRARLRPRAARARRASSAAGIFRPEAVQRVVAKFEANADRASETDEMALVGAISTMLLHEQLVANPTLAPAARPTRVVVGATVQSEPRLPEAVR